MLIQNEFCDGESVILIQGFFKAVTLAGMWLFRFLPEFWNSRKNKEKIGETHYLYLFY